MSTNISLGLLTGIIILLLSFFASGWLIVELEFVALALNAAYSSETKTLPTQPELSELPVHTFQN
jgi:hypothetical protein